MLDMPKAKNAILFIIEQLGGVSSLHEIAKILYTAEKLKISEYGDMIVWDSFVALPDGPVPTRLYDMFKPTFNSWVKENYPGFIESFDVDFENNFKIKGLEKPDTDYLTKRDLAYLTRAVDENRGLSYRERSDKSHDSAWEKGFKSETAMHFIEPEWIAEDLKASGEILQRLSLNIINRDLSHT